MSSHGRCWDAAWDALYGYEDGKGQFFPGPLAEWDARLIREVVDVAVAAVYPIAFEKGREVGP